MTTETQAPDPARGRFWVEYDNDTGPGDEGLIEWWSVVDEQSGDTLCKCSSQTDADRIAALLNGSAIPAPEGAPLAQALERGMRDMAAIALELEIGCEPSSEMVDALIKKSTPESAIGRMREALAAAPAPQAAPVALTAEQIAEAVRSADIAFALRKHRTYEHALTRAAISEFCRVNGIPAPKEPTNDR